jgi:MinD superfamily P-loop ATPase
MTEIATPVGQSKNIYWVGGGKGGVGKSMLALASLDYLVGRGEQVLLVECDTSADFGRW